MQTIFKSSVYLICLILIPFSCKEHEEYALRPVEGPWDTVRIDTKTSLKKLILRLEMPWRFVETGKGYWIGYTDDMYSIAFHEGKAIPQLIKFIDNSDSLRAKIGALYTIHLIGIKSKVVDRFSEEFKDSIARKALLTFINDKQLHNTVMLLIKRDPWISDIPYLMKYLSKPEDDYSKVLSALQRYDFEDKPFAQKIPEDILLKVIKIRTNEPYSRKPIHDLLALSKALGEKVVIDDEIMQSKEWSDGMELLKSDTIHVEGQYASTILEFLTNSIFSFCGFEDNRFFYVYEGNKIYIYGPNKAREIWLKWWEKLPNEKKEKIKAANKL